MTWAAVAWKDFRDAGRSRALWALVGVFVLLTVVSAYVYAEVPELVGETNQTFHGLVFFTASGTALFVPLAAIIVCYKAIAGERELGSIKLLLSLPTTRTNVFLGKVIGRAGVITVGMGVGIVAGLGLGSLLLGAFDPVAAVVFAAVTLVFAVVYAAIVVSLSASTGSTVRATTYALGFFVVFELLWDAIPLGVVYVMEGFSLPSALPDWYLTLAMISPATAYFSSLTALLPTPASDPAPGDPGTGPDLGLDFGDGFLTGPEMGLVFLALWLVLPLAFGAYRFNRADL